MRRRDENLAPSRHAHRPYCYPKNAEFEPGQNANVLNVAFKGEPNEENGIWIKRFMTGCYDALKAARLITGGAKTYFFVGCPSGWLKKPGLREKYEALLREAGITEVSVEPESRAAFIQAKEARDLRATATQLTGTVLIIDIGSSTTDFTIVVNQKINSVEVEDDGVPLGAALIDKLILDRAVASSATPDRVAELMNSHQPNRARCEIECRRAKEKYFNNPALYENPKNLLFFDVRLDRQTRLELEITGATMKEILDTPISALQGRSWRGTYRGLLESIRDRMAERGLKPDLIIMTGGDAHDIHSERL